MHTYVHMYVHPRIYTARRTREGTVSNADPCHAYVRSASNKKRGRGRERSAIYYVFAAPDPAPFARNILCRGN